MASIFKRKTKYSVIYSVKDETGERRQKWETFYTWDEAVKRKEQIEYMQRHGVDNMPVIVTVEDLLREYMQVVGVNRLAMSTYESKQALIRHYIMPTLGNAKICDLNTRMMERYYLSLSEVRRVSAKDDDAEEDKYLSDHTKNEIWKIL